MFHSKYSYEYLSMFRVQIPVDTCPTFALKRRSFLFVIDIKTHAKGAYKTPSRVSFSMQNRGKLPFLWQFTLFVVSSRIAVGICSILALGNRNSLTIAQKGFLHDKERMISSDLINEKKQFKLHLSNRGVIMLLCEV